MIEATVERPFADDEGFHRPGEAIAISSGRFADLKANGLVSAKLEEKQAPQPVNKMMPDAAQPQPANGAARAGMVPKTK